jgi:hypothetical protein
MWNFMIMRSVGAELLGQTAWLTDWQAHGEADRPFSELLCERTCVLYVCVFVGVVYSF